MDFADVKFCFCFVLSLSGTRSEYICANRMIFDDREKITNNE